MIEKLTKYFYTIGASDKKSLKKHVAA